MNVHLKTAAAGRNPVFAGTGRRRSLLALGGLTLLSVGLSLPLVATRQPERDTFDKAPQKQPTLSSKTPPGELLDGQDFSELKQIIDLLTHFETLLPARVNLSKIQAQYWQATDPQVLAFIREIYQAEAAGRIHLGTAGDAIQQVLQPGTVYRYFAGYTLPQERPPDDGIPGLARIAKRYLKEVNGKTVRVDLCEGWDVKWVDSRLETRLEEIRIHFTPNIPDAKTRAYDLIYSRFHVEQKPNSYQLHHVPEYAPDNEPLERPNDFIRRTPHDCMSCHLGLVGFPRTHQVTLHHFGKNPPAVTDAMQHRAFNLQTFLPDEVYLTPPTEHLGTRELLEKAPHAFKIPSHALTPLTQAFDTLNAFSISKPPALP